MSEEDTKKAEVFLFDLTDMTGKKAKANRRVVILTVEMNRATLIASLVSIVPALVIALITVPFIGVWSVLVAAVAFMAFMLFFLGHMSRCLMLMQWSGKSVHTRARHTISSRLHPVHQRLSVYL